MSNKLPSIGIQVETQYVPWQSDSQSERYVFAYSVTIMNNGSKPAALTTRHMIITDANGKVHDASGDSVVGEELYLAPGEGFRYTSGAVLDTPVGCMEGSVELTTDDGESVNAAIKPFTLAIPQILH